MINFIIIDSCILNANMASIKELSGSEMSPELSSNGPLALVVQTLDSAMHQKSPDISLSSK